VRWHTNWAFIALLDANFTCAYLLFSCILCLEMAYVRKQADRERGDVQPSGHAIRAATRKPMNEELTAQPAPIPALASQLKERASDSLAAASSAAQDEVRSHPWRVVLIAALTGAVIGRLISRPRAD
jgi:hypothetical protein